MVTENVPYLTIAITNRCNFRCFYCSPDGDGGMGEAYGASDSDLDIEDLEEKIKIAENEGVSKIRISGGEPLLVSKIVDLLNFIEKETGLEYALATNGALVDMYVDDLEKLGRVDIRISLDTLDRENFSKICGCSVLQYDKVMSNIRLLAGKKMLNRVAAVITDRNVDEIGELIDFCESLGINLKLLDMYATPEIKEQWDESYSVLTRIKQIVEKRSDSVRQIDYTRSFGIPALEYTTKNGIKVRVKDSTSGTRYHSELCAKCPALPCQEGLYTILYSPDKKLIPCRLSPTHFDASTPEQFENNLKYLIQIFQSSYHENKFWGMKQK